MLLSTPGLYFKILPGLLFKVIEITRVNKQRDGCKIFFFFSESTFTLQKKIEGEGETCSETPVGADWWPTCSEVWGLGPVNQVLPPERAKE